MDEEKHLLVFSAAWCGPCRMMKAQVWQDPTIKEKLDNFSSVSFIDIDDPKNMVMSMTYRVSAVPTIYIVDGEGVPIKAGHTMNINQTLQFLDQ